MARRSSRSLYHHPECYSVPEVSPSYWYLLYDLTGAQRRCKEFESPRALVQWLRLYTSRVERIITIGAKARYGY